MIYANIDEIECIVDLITALSRDVDNAFYRIKDVASSLQDSTQFQTYSGYMNACEAMNRASDEMNILNNRLIALNDILKNVPNEYKEIEKKNISLINNAIDVLRLISDGMEVSIQAEGVGLQMSEQSVSADNLQQMVENEYLKMQVVDITSVSKKIKDEYEVKEVIPVIPVLSAEEVIAREED